jgi:type IV pilus assembly protein PilA
MKNKKGFTLVELLAVIVILALIMGIAVVSIGSVLQSSKKKIMFENAQSILNGVKKQLLINNDTPNASGTTYYGFNSGLLDSGGVESPLGGDFAYRTFNSSSDSKINDGSTAVLWKLGGTAPTGCAANVQSYVSYNATSGEYSICLTAGAGNNYIDGTEANVVAQADSALK